MNRPARAVLFDLDDTLYPERRYALSAFRHLSRTLAVLPGVDAKQALATLVRSLRQGRRDTALQTLCDELGHSPESIPSMVKIMRGHMPALMLPPASAAVLDALRADWRLGIVTNGFPAVQRRKVAALGVSDLVDAVIFAYEHGTGLGKPDPQAFLEAASQVGVAPEHCVFVGDDLERDVRGARAVGMCTIRLSRAAASRVAAVDDADAIASSVADVPRLATALLSGRASRCA